MKDIYELLNETKIDFSEVTEAEVSEIERERGKRKLMQSIKKKNKSKKIVGAAAAFLIVVTSMTAINPAWAKNIPIVGELFQKELVNKNSKYIDYAKVIGKTKVQNGVTVTFESAAVDNNMLSLSFKVKNDNEAIKNPETLFMPIAVKFNGNAIGTNGSRDCKVVDKNTVKYLDNIDLNEKELPENLNVDIEIKNLFNKEGDWGVKFSMDTKEIKKNTHVVKMDNKFNVNGINFGVNKVTISPLTTNIEYYAESNYKCTDERLSLIFLVLDQDGNEVKYIGGSTKDKDCTGGQKGKILFSMNYINTSKVSKLKLIPLYFKGVKSSKVDSKEVNLDKFSPFKLKVNNNAEIDIENCKVDGEYLIVKYNNKYHGKTIVSPYGGDIGIKVNGTILKEEEDFNLTEKYRSEGVNTRVYKIGNAKTVEIEAYDTMLKELYEDKAITVENKNR